MVSLFLNKYRLLHRLRQKEMADRLGIGRVHYAKLETGERSPSVRLLNKIGKSLGVDVVDIFQKTNGDAIDEDLQEILERVLMMNSRNRKKVKNFIRELGGVK